MSDAIWPNLGEKRMAASKERDRIAGMVRYGEDLVWFKIWYTFFWLVITILIAAISSLSTERGYSFWSYLCRMFSGG